MSTATVEPTARPPIAMGWSSKRAERGMSHRSVMAWSRSPRAPVGTPCRRPRARHARFTARVSTVPYASGRPTRHECHRAARIDSVARPVR
jgi:hypothetical protein